MTLGKTFISENRTVNATKSTTSLKHNLTGKPMTIGNVYINLYTKKASLCLSSVFSFALPNSMNAVASDTNIYVGPQEAT